MPKFFELPGWPQNSRNLDLLVGTTTRHCHTDTAADALSSSQRHGRDVMLGVVNCQRISVWPLFFWVSCALPSRRANQDRFATVEVNGGAGDSDKLHASGGRVQFTAPNNKSTWSL